MNQSQSEHQREGDVTVVMPTIPETIEAAVDMMEFEMTDWEHAHVLEMPQSVACEGLGPLARPEWQLWDRHSPIVQHCISEHSLAHSQDISCLLMDALWSRVHGVPSSTAALAAALCARWRAQGFDPVTMRRLSAQKVMQPTIALRPLLKK